MVAVLTSARCAARRVMLELGLVARRDPSVWLSNGEGVHIFPGEGDAMRWRADRAPRKLSIRGRRVCTRHQPAQGVPSDATAASA